jgi:hypothetical protein
MKRILAVAVVCAIVPWAHAQLYKWVDDNGKVHYSDQPPPSSVKSTKTIERARAPAVSAPSGNAAPETAKGPRTVADQEMEFRKRRVQAAEAEAKRQQEVQASAEKQRNCQQAKARVTNLERGGRVTKQGADGEQYFLEDADIARELVEARKVADSWCNS